MLTEYRGCLMLNGKFKFKIKLDINGINGMFKNVQNKEVCQIYISPSTKTGTFWINRCF